MEHFETDSNLLHEYGYVREYDTHRIPDDAVVDWDYEILTYCNRCGKDLLISNDMPRMIYYCKNCRDEILIEEGIVHPAKPEYNHDEMIFSRVKPVSTSSKYYNKSILYFLFSLLFLVFNISLEITHTVFYNTALWIFFGLLLLTAIIYLFKGFANKRPSNEANRSDYY